MPARVDPVIETSWGVRCATSARPVSRSPVTTLSTPGGRNSAAISASRSVDTGVVSDSYLSLDQGMVMAAIGNALAGDFLRTLFVTDPFERALRPPIGVEEFNAFPRGCTIEGTAGNDRLVGTPGDDVICGEGGDDVLSGGGGNDVLLGDGGDDVLSADTGDDTIYGGPGDDRLSGGPGSDHLEGGTGRNRCPDLTAGDTANACG